MKLAKWIIGALASIVLSYFILQESGFFSNQNETTNETDQSLKPLIKQRFNDDGSLKSDVTIVNNVRHGVAHNYYNDGSVHSEIFYKNGKKDSISTWYYQDGKIYRTTAYENGIKHGIQKKYYRNGNLMAEIPYKNNMLYPGTKEYSESGKPINTNIKFSYDIINKTNEYNTVIVKVTGKNIEEVADFKAFYSKDNKEIKGERQNDFIRFHVPSKVGKKQKHEVSIWLTIKTKMNNKKIIDKKLWVETGVAS